MASAGDRRLAGRAAVVVVLLALAGAVAGCTRSGPPVTDGPAFNRLSGSPPTLSLVAAGAGRVGWDKPVQLYADNGTFSSVRVTDATGFPISGDIRSDGHVWTNSTLLVPDTRYQVSATLLGQGKQPSIRSLAFSTKPAARTLQVRITPGDDAAVGVGQPVVVSFNRPVIERHLVEEHLSVTATPAVLGAWHWISATEVHYRPRDYWPSGDHVFVSTSLDRVNVGDGVWGHGNHTARFTIGQARISEVNVALHTMTVTDNGRLVRVLPISAGRDKYPTAGGVHIALDKQPEITMDSTTVGIPRTSPDGYYEKVYWDVRISYGGAFVHAAPWSVHDQGHSNVSHGCVNLSPADAAWFYRFTQRGDIINISGTPRGPEVNDPGMVDWNIPWSRWATR